MIILSVIVHNQTVNEDEEQVHAVHVEVVILIAVLVDGVFGVTSLVAVVKEVNS